jgi:hypothetical protein
MNHRPAIWLALVFVAFAFLVILAAPDVRAQAGASGGVVAELSAERVDSERAHLLRIAVWGGASLALGAGLFAYGQRADAPLARGFGMQTALWGGINGAIGLLADPRPASADWASALGGERFLHDVLLVNMGLNVGYMAVGAALVAASHRGVRHPQAWRGHGWAVVVQGAALFALDGVVLLASRARIAGLLGVPGDLSALSSPGGLGIALTF